MDNLILENVSFQYNGVPALRGVSLEIRHGELFTLLGPSGCGKTTLLRLLAGFLRPDSGRILLDGRDISSLGAEKRGMGVVFQNYALFPQMSVEENIAYGLKIRRLPREMIREKCREALELINMTEYAKKNVEQLSGGQQQRVAIARALVVNPDMLLLDEPLSNLDAGLRIRMRNEIRELQSKTGVTTLFITHDQQEALSISHRIAVLDHGEVQQIGTPYEIYNEPCNPFVAEFVGKTNLIHEADAADWGERAPASGFIRPERLELCSPGPYAVTTRVEHVRFDGPSFVYTLRSSSGAAYDVTVLNTGARPFQTGDTVGLRPIRAERRQEE